MNKLSGYLPLIASGFCLVLAIMTIFFCSKQFGLTLFLLAGGLQGIYYGLNNHQIFHAGHDQPSNEAKANALWVHILCSLSGAIALYFLLLRLSPVFWSNIPHDNLVISDFVLFMIGVLGLTGLLPMTLWFFARSGDALANMIKK